MSPAFSLFLLSVGAAVGFLSGLLGIGLFSSSAGLAGKVATAQVPFHMAWPPRSRGNPPGTPRRTGREKRKNAIQSLRWLLALIILATAIKVWYGIFL